MYFVVSEYDVTSHHLYSSVRVLCFEVFQKNNTYAYLAPRITNTWGRRCNRMVYFVEEYQSVYPSRYMRQFKRDRSKQSTSFIHRILTFLYLRFRREFEWFVHAENSAFVVMENLRYVHGKYNASEAMYMAYSFKVSVMFPSRISSYSYNIWLLVFSKNDVFILT